MNKDVAEFIKECVACDRSKTHRHLQPPPGEIEVPKRRFSAVHIDVVGPLPPPAGGGPRHLLTIIDRTSRWLEAVPLLSTDSNSIINAFVSNWVARFGVPSTIISDQGTNFTSSTFDAFNKLTGSQLKFTTAFHPQCNGMVERVHRTLKAALVAKGGEWLSALPWVLLGMRSAPRSDDGSSPAEAVYGWPLVLPGSLLDAADLDQQEVSTAVQRLQTGFPVRAAPPPPPSKPLPIMKFAYLRQDGVRPALSPRYQGPFRVLRQSRQTIILQMGTREVRHNISRVKPYLGKSDPETALPPRRGRPRV